MSEQTTPRHLEGLDGLRGLLALSVVVAHVVGHLAPVSTAPLHIGLLAQAVVVFFTLSGFLIFLPFCRAILTGADLPRLGRYVRRRVARIYPAYVVIFLVSNFALAAVFVDNVLESSEPRSDAGTGRMTGVGEVLLHLTLLQNLVPDEVQRGLNVAWSLSTELGFYLVLPLVAVAMLALVRRSKRPPALLVLAPIVLMALVGLASKALLTRQVASSGQSLEETTFGPHGWAVFAESTVALADVFAAGMAAALVYVLIGQGRLASWTGRRLYTWGTVLIAVSGVAALVTLSAHSAFANTFLAVAAGALLVLVTEPTARGQVSPIGRLLDVAPIKFLGDTSLSIYLWHFPVLVLVTRWDWYGADTLPGAAWSVALVTAITIALSVVTYRLVERPAMRRVGSQPRERGTGKGSMDSEVARVPVAIAHDYLSQRGGAERVVLAMARAFPGAPIYTTVYEPDLTYPEFRDLDIRVTPLNKVGLFRRHHRIALPLYAPVVSGTTIDADVVVASTSGWAHGFRTTGRSIVYCHSPAHWLYQGEHYMGKRSLVARIAMAVLGPPLRWWDVRAAKRADVYLANSTEVRGRIQRRYGRDAQVVPAPIPERIAHAAGHQDHGSGHNPEPGFYLCVSRLLPYKHVDAVVGAFADLPDRRLVVVGSGPLESDLTASAGPNVTFLKDISDDALTRLYTDARALIAVAYEDYGLTPVEAAVTGTPCIVLRWGGYLDTMVEDVTATFIKEPTPADIGDGIARFEQRTWDREVIRAHSDAFTEKVFIGTLHELVRHEAEQVR